MPEQTATAAIKALCKAQAAMPKAEKDSTNPHFDKKYESLAAVQDAALPHLHSNGFAVLHYTGKDDDGRYLETILLHESGHRFWCRIPLIVDKNSMQGFKSAVTYARRIGLGCLSGVAPEDDDGNLAVDNPPKRGDWRGRSATSPPPTQPNEVTPPPTEEAAQKVIATLQNIWGEAELVGYWTGLAQEQPGMQSAPGVAEAKDAQKAAITKRIDGDDAKGDVKYITIGEDAA